MRSTYINRLRFGHLRLFPFLLALLVSLALFILLLKQHTYIHTYIQYIHTY
jgi:hypothetical protein